MDMKNNDFTVDFEAIGKRIKKHRKIQRISQKKLAKELHISPIYLSGIENGKINMSLKTILQLAHILSVSLDELIYDVSYF